MAIPLVERGVVVRGIERSQPMIDRLRDKTDEQRLPVVRGDMATTRTPGACALVYVVFNSLSCLLTHLFRRPHRDVWPAELDLMAQLAGLELEGRHGDWTGAPFTAESTSHVSVHRGPGP